MRLIKPAFTIIEQVPGIEGIYKIIEQAGRTCYKSEDKITETSAEAFTDRIIKSGHWAVLEHATVYLKLTPSEIHIYHKYMGNPYTKVNKVNSKDSYPIPTYYISTNYRVLVENNWLDDLKYLCEPTEYHEKRVCVRFICDRGVSHEFVRHRTMSFAQESTRYCNYSKDKFGNELTFIMPSWCDMSVGNYTLFAEQNKENLEFIQVMKNFEKDEKYPISSTSNGRFLCATYWSEKYYLDLLNKGWTPQQARAVLPNALKTELVMTGFVSDWKHFFELRATEAGAKGPHPQASELANPLYKEFLKRNYI